MLTVRLSQGAQKMNALWLGGCREIALSMTGALGPLDLYRVCQKAGVRIRHGTSQLSPALTQPLHLPAHFGKVPEIVT